MDTKNLNDMKYVELIQYSKKLGIEHSIKKPKKETIIEAIRAHLSSKTSNNINNNNINNDTNSTNDYEQQQQFQQNDNDQDDNKTKTKSKKLVKKVKKTKSSKQKDTNQQEDSENINELNCTMTRSKANALKLNQTALNESQPKEVEQEPVKEKSQVKKKVKKVKKSEKETEAEEVLAETRVKVKKSKTVTENVEETEVKVKKTKKVKKQTETKSPVEKKTKKVKKIKKKLTSTEEVQAEIQEKENKASAREVPEEIHEQDEFKLELEEEEDEEAKVEEIENKNEKSQMGHLELEDSLITNDEDSNQAQEKEEQKIEEEKITENLNITKDILNEELDKNEPVSGASVSCSSFYTSKPSEPVEEIKSAIEEEVKVEEPKPRQGARIVRPKQVVNVVHSIKNIRNEIVGEQVEQKVVEVVRREAGPRIVKPVIAEEATNDSKRKLNEQNANKTKKLKENLTSTKKKPENETTAQAVKPLKAAPAPDFRAMHEKELAKMESIDSYANRRQERHTKLTEKRNSLSSPQVIANEAKSALAESTSTTSQPEANNINKQPILKQKCPTSSTKPTTQPIVSKKTPLKSSTTPKFAKTLASTAGTLLSNIPRILINKDKKPTEEKEEKQVEQKETSIPEPKTPEVGPTESKFSKLHKTPSSVTKPTESSILKSAVKRNSSIKVDSQNAIPPQLQSSSFVRRKSFDLSKSLSRPLNYNPHTGKLKPVDFSSKSVFLAALASTGASTNFANETRIIESKPSKPAASVNDQTINLGPTSLNQDKRRLSVIKQNVLKSEAVPSTKSLTDQIKSDNLKSKNDKSTAIAKKLRLEKVQASKNSHRDQFRKLDQVNDLEDGENEPPSVEAN